MSARQPTDRRGKGTWRSLVPFTAALFFMGVFFLVVGVMRWGQVPPFLLVVGVVNLAAGIYFARDIQQKRRAEREAARSGTPDGPNG